jgi:hypothetical protein
MFLLLLNCSHYVFNSVSCPSSFTRNAIINPFLFLFIPEEVRFLLFLCRKLLFRSQAVQCRKGSDSFRLQAAIAFICLMTLLGRTLCRFAVSANRKLSKDLVETINHLGLHGLVVR